MGAERVPERRYCGLRCRLRCRAIFQSTAFHAIPLRRPDFDAFLDSLEEFIGFASGLLTNVQKVFGDRVTKYMAVQLIVYLDGLMRGIYVDDTNEVDKFRKWLMESYPQIRLLVQ